MVLRFAYLSKGNTAFRVDTLFIPFYSYALLTKCGIGDHTHKKSHLLIRITMWRCEPTAHEMQGCFYIWTIIGIPPWPPGHKRLLLFQYTTKPHTVYCISINCRTVIRGSTYLPSMAENTMQSSKYSSGMPSICRS